MEQQLLDGLRHGEDGERFQLLPSYEARLAEALQAALKGTEASQTVDMALRYIAAFRGLLASPGVAKVLSTVLRAEPLAALYLRRYADHSVDTVRAFAEQLGEQRSHRAPSFGAKAPSGSIRASDLLKPGGLGSSSRIY